MSTYDKFDIFISKFINKDVSMDFWYDFANIESINMINKFTKNDWSKLLKEVNNKNYLWKIRSLESFDSSNWKEKKVIILEIIKSCNNDELLLIRGCTRLADMLPSENEDNTLQIKEKSTEGTTPFFCARSYCTFRYRYFGYPSQFGSPVLP